MIWRLLAGFLLAPIIPSALVAALMGGLTSQWSNFWGDLWLVLVVAEAASVLLGAPTYFVLRRFRKIGILECVVAGALIGLVVGILGTIVGTLSGLLFWAIAIRTEHGPNPGVHTDAQDRGAPVTPTR